MILRYILFSLALLSLGSSEVLERPKRDTYAGDPKGYLDAVIGHLIFSIPVKITEAKEASEADLRLAVAKRVTQGWSIMLGSWKDILSDYVENNRTLGNLGDYNVIYNYGFLASYGVGFGYPLLLGLPEDQLDCDANNFVNTLNKYGLQGGINGLLASGASKAIAASLIAEFDLLVRVRISCILNRDADNIEAAEVLWALDKLVAALNLRLGLESDNAFAYHHHVQKRADNSDPPVLPKSVITAGAQIAS